MPPPEAIKCSSVLPRLRKHKQRLAVLFAEELGARSQTCVSTTAKPCQDPSSMSEGPQPERRVCPKGEPSAMLHLCHQHPSQATHRPDSSLGSSVALRRVCRTRPCGDAHTSFLQAGLHLVLVESDHRVHQRRDPDGKGLRHVSPVIAFVHDPRSEDGT